MGFFDIVKTVARFACEAVSQKLEQYKKLKLKYEQYDDERLLDTLKRISAEIKKANKQVKWQI